MLGSHLEILSETDTDPFEFTSFYIEEASVTVNLLDSDHEEESDIEIV